MNVERKIDQLRAAVRASMQRFIDVSSDLFPVPETYIRLRPDGTPVESSMKVLPGQVCGSFELGECEVQGDCLSPWFHDGDVQFYELGRPAFAGDVVLFRVPESAISGDSLISKVLYPIRRSVAAAVQRPTAGA